MEAQPQPRRRPFLVRLFRAALNVFGVVGLIVLAGMTLQAFVEQDERARFPPPGQLVDIGDARFIHLRQWGELNAGPTVILDISAAMVSSVWSWVGQGLADRGYRVVAYDRPGMGWSHGTWQPRDARHAADALTAALETAQIPDPYVVVAHSYGAFSSRVFTASNRERVTALVLLDSTHPDTGGPIVAVPYRVQALLGHVGFFQIVSLPNGFSSLPAHEIDGAHAVTRWTTHLDTTAEELEVWYDSAEQVRDVADYGDLPVLVVSAAPSGIHHDIQQDLLGISSASRFAQIDAEHMGMLLNEPHAAQIVEMVDSFIESSN